MAVAVRVGPTTDGRSDHALVAAVRRGDDGAFETLFERYQRRIAAYAYGMVGDWARAEDVTQDVFISALRRMRVTERPIAFKPWIFEIAKNACIDQFRRTRRSEEISYDAEERMSAADAGRLADTGPVPEEAAAHKQSLDDLVGAFGGLSRSHHDILVLRELEGLSYRQIGERMGLSRPSVESTLFRARRRLGEEYDELTTGRRCLRVRGTLEESADGALGVRDRGRVSRHLAHCQPCRRYALDAGVPAELFARPAARSRVAALIPVPALLRRHPWHGAAGDPSALWSKAAAAGLTIVAAAGAGVASHSLAHPGHQSAPVSHREAPAPPAAGASSPGVQSSRVRRPGSATPHRKRASTPRGAPRRAPAGSRPGARGSQPATPGATSSTRSAGAGVPSASAGTSHVEHLLPGTVTASGLGVGAAHTVTTTIDGVTHKVTGTSRRIRRLVRVAPSESAPRQTKSARTEPDPGA